MIERNGEKYTIFDAHSHWASVVKMASYEDLEDIATLESIRMIKQNEEMIRGSTKKLVKLFLLFMDHHGIDKSQVFSIIPDDNHFISLMKKHGEGRLFPLGMVSPKDGNIEEQLDEVKKLGLYGLKIHPDYQKLDFKAKEFHEIFAFCEQHNMLVISHTGSHGNLRDIVTQAKDFPRMPFIIGHMGLGPQVDQAYEAAKNTENTYLEISGQGYQYMIQKAVDDPDIGPERVLFGSDFPSLAPQVEIEKVLALKTSPGNRKKIFHDNLARIYENLGFTASLTRGKDEKT
ncbi:MAG: amidohydrolase family protein [Promethearchaeota archaeon]